MRLTRCLPAAACLAALLLLPGIAPAQEPPACPFVVDVAGEVGVDGVTHTSIQAAVDDLPNPGPCQVTVKPGTYVESVLISEANTLAQSESERIVIMAEVPADAALPDEEKVVVTPPDAGGEAYTYGFRIERSKLVTVRYFDLRGAREAVVLHGLGGDNGNEDIVIEGNDVHANGDRSHRGAITVGSNSSRTWLVNNLIRDNAGNGVRIEGSGAPIDDTVYVVNNTVLGNGWNGLRVTRKRVVYLVNNLIVGNGTAELSGGGNSAGRWGLLREDQGGQGVLERTTLVRNMFYNNGEIHPADEGGDIAHVEQVFGDGSDDGNYTTTGAEAGAPAIVGCTFPDCTGAAELSAIFVDPASDLRLVAESPAIDRGLDSLEHNGMERVPTMDFEGEARPQDGTGDGIEVTDIGYDEVTDVGAAFRAIADCSPTTGVVPLQVRFRTRGEFAGGSIVRYRWDFDGDGTFDSSDPVPRDFLGTFEETGVFLPLLEVTNNFGETATDTCTITVVAGEPVALADVDPSNGPVPLTVTFSGTGFKVGGEIVLHSYDFDGDGVFDFETNDFSVQPESITFIVNHATCGGADQLDFYLNGVLILAASGTVSCTCNSQEPAFTVTDPVALGNWNTGGTNTLRVDVGSNIAVAYIRAELDPGDPVCVFDQLSGGSCANRNLCNSYRFGGSFQAPADSGITRSTVEHTYDAVGTYGAMFQVTDDEGKTARASAASTSVRVGPAGTPIVRASAAPTEGKAPLTVSFGGTAEDDGTIVLWEWDFDGDGTFDFSSPTSPAAAFTYVDSGTFVAALRATDDTGLSSVDLVEISLGLTATLSIPDDTFDPSVGETVAIQTSISAATAVRVLLVDDSRSVVRTLVDGEERSAGSYQDFWDGRDDGGELLPQAPYYAILEYEVGGETERIDLTDTTGGLRYNPSRNRLPSVFRPLEDNLLRITFNIPSSRGASEVLAFVGQFNVDTRFVTLLEREPLGVGSHTIYWDGTAPTGGIAEPPPGDRFLFGIFGFTLPDNAIMVQRSPVISAVSVEPNYFDPSTPDFLTPDDPLAVVTYTLDKTADVELTATNLTTGVVVRRIVDPNVAPGAGLTISWDGRATNGIFVDKGDYRLTLRAVDSTGSASIHRFALVRVFH